MRVTILFPALFALAIPIAAAAQGNVSIERGLQVSIIGGCHDCHTEGYSESEGKIDPEKALRGHSVGWRGPWGTSYASNLRRTFQGMNERGCAEYLKGFRARPPMPWYNVRAMETVDLQSLCLYIRSLGEPGDHPPAGVDADKEPTTPYIQLVPPQMPKN